MSINPRVAVENVNHPGLIRQVDAARYEAMKRAILRIVPTRAPGRTIAEIQASVLAHLPEALFPGGSKSGWWVKTVQLDLEAKGMLQREKTTPVRLHRDGSGGSVARSLAQRAALSGTEQELRFPK
jgi:hypothetical protein